MPEVVTLASSCVAVALAVGVWAHYFWRISKEQVPRRPVGHAAGMVAAGTLGVFAVVWGPAVGEPISWVALALLPVSLVNALLFLWLLTQAPTPDTKPAFAVGERLPSFQATTPEGHSFSSAELDGQRVLLKFFRGHW